MKIKSVYISEKYKAYINFIIDEKEITLQYENFIKKYSEFQEDVDKMIEEEKNK